MALIGPAADKTFNELLAETAGEQKDQLVVATLKAFKEGEPSAIKLVTQALLETQYSEQQSFPITDERYKQIIQLAAEAISAGEI